MSSEEQKPESAVNAHTAGKTAKRRKSQTEEEFERQKEQYKNGPLVQTSDWLLEKDFKNGETGKIERANLKNAAERAYFLGNYQQALDILENAKDPRWNIRDKEMKEFEILREACNQKLN